MHIIEEMANGTWTTYVGAFYIGAWVYLLHSALFMMNQRIEKWEVPSESTFSGFFCPAVMSTLLLYNEGMQNDAAVLVVYVLIMLCDAYVEALVVWDNRTVLPDWRLIAGVTQVGLYIAATAAILCTYVQ